MDTFILKMNHTTDGSWDGEVEYILPGDYDRNESVPVKGAMDLIDAMEKAMETEQTR